MVRIFQRYGINRADEGEVLDESLRREFIGKSDAGNSHVRFDEGGGETHLYSIVIFKYNLA